MNESRCPNCNAPAKEATPLPPERYLKKNEVRVRCKSCGLIYHADRSVVRT